MKSRVILLLLFLTSVVGLSLTMAAAPPLAAAPMTYTVTSTSCTGPCSITEAMALTNANPGTDTITFTKDLQIQAGQCLPGFSGSGLDYSMVQATESVIFEGNDAAGVQITPTRMQLETGQQGSYTLRLTSKPLSEVIVYLQPREGLTLDTDLCDDEGGTCLRFTPQNWQVAQTVVVTMAGKSLANVEEDTNVVYLTNSSNCNVALMPSAIKEPLLDS